MIVALEYLEAFKIVKITLINPACVGHRSITLQWMLLGFLWTYRYIALMLLPVVEHEYCGYCVKATTLEIPSLT